MTRANDRSGRVHAVHARSGRFGFLRLFNRNTLKQAGPGVITGAADDDPSGIATYSQAGAQFGLDMLWTIVLTFPMMVGIQMVSARIGRVTGEGLAANMRKQYHRSVLVTIVSLLVIANTINVAADLAAMGEALRLLIGGGAHGYTIAFGLLSLTLQVFIPYHRYVRLLRWLTLSLFAYVAVVFMVQVPWKEVASHMVVPHIVVERDFAMLLVAVFGTTISPYLFFWQASQEVEELRASGRAQPLVNASMRHAHFHLRRIKIDTYVGMAFSNLIAFFIVLSTAVTLHASGVEHIETSAQAAEALRPIAGHLTFLLFSLGIIGTGLLAVPVLAGSAAYAVADCFEWRQGLDRNVTQARRFYSIIALATLGGVALNFAPIDPIRALLWSAVINGVIAVPIMVVMMLMSRKPELMGPFIVTRRLQVLGWLATLGMFAAVATMLYYFVA